MHWRLSLLLSTFHCALLCSLLGHVQSMKAEEWKSRSIYQVLTDRFAPTSAGDETLTCNTAARQYCGGTWQGIIRRLDYIQGMGFNAIWISPITKQIDNNTAYGEAFHGYWQQDIYSLNPHFGSASDLLALSSALHARGMALMVDVVVNHFGSPYQVDYSMYTPFNDGSYFHEEAFITDYNNQTMVEQGWLGNGEVPLPDVDTENPTVVNTFNSWISNLVQTYGIDGLRLDTVKHVRKDFWPGFVSAAGVFSLGEVLSGDPAYLSAYQPYVGGLLDYGTYYPLLRSFAQGGSMYELASLTAPSYRAQFKDTQLLATFMENHDQPRFTYSTASDDAIVANAIAYTMLSDGIPIIYYGQEQSYSGGADPSNREALWPSGYRITNLYTYLAKLNIARNLAWNAGFGSNLTTGLYVDGSTTVSQKGPLLLVLCNQGSTVANKTVSFASSFASGTILVNVLTCKSILVGKSSTSVTIVAGAPQIYLPQGLAQQMCTNIIAPTSSTSMLSKITSIFTSSTKAAAKSAAKSSQTTYNSGTTSTTSQGLAITKSSPTMAVPTQTTSSTSSKTTSPAAGRAGFPAPSATSTSSSNAAVKPFSSSSTRSLASSSPITTTMSSTTKGAGRQGFAPQSSTTSTSTTSAPGRVGFSSYSSNNQQRKRSVNDSGTEAQSPVAGRPKTPQQQQNSFVQGRKQFSKHTATTPPASFSQHYRAERTATTTSPRATNGLSSHYSYSANHLPLPNGFSQKDRSSSESNLQELQYRKGHRSQSHSLHTLRKQSSSSSLVLRPPTSRAKSFNAGGVPSVPSLSKLDTRAALFAENAPYVHAELLSTSSLVPPPIPRSRRSSGASIYSFKSEKLGAGGGGSGGNRYRHASLERQSILAQEHVGSSINPSSGIMNAQQQQQQRSNQVMQYPQHGNSRTSLHSKHGSMHSHVHAHQRRIDQRPQLQDDIRNFRV